MLANATDWLQGTTCRRCHQTGRDGRLTNPNLKEQSQPVRVRHAFQAHVGSSQCAKEVRAVPPGRRNSYHVDFSKRGCTTLRWRLQLGQHRSWAAWPGRAGPGRWTQLRLSPRHQSSPPTCTCAPASQPWTLRPACGRGRNPAGCGAQREPLLGAAAVKNKSTCNMKESLQFTRGSGRSEGRGLGSLAAECRSPG